MGAPALFLLLSLLEAVSYSKRIPFQMQTMGPSCVRCCGTSEKPGSLYSSPSNYRMASDKPMYPWPQVKPNIDITILKGSKGENGEIGLPGRTGKEGLRGSVGSQGAKGSRGKAGPAGHNCKHQYAAFSVGRRKGLHSGETPAQLIFDTVFVNLYGHFDMFTGTFRCRVPGIYSFDLNVHTWNFKETYLHLMRNDRQMVILYAQTSERSIMQSQSVMLELVGDDEVWVQLFRQGRENAIYSDEVDVYITFSGHLIKPADD